jgi:RNA polymerase sigma-70 factor (ECF subfamily)
VHDAPSVSDVELMRQVQAGRPERFSELVRRYQSALLRVAMSRLGRHDWAEEAVQETFVAAFKSAHTYREEFGFRTWLWTILLNKCKAFFTRRVRRPEPVAWSEAVKSGEISGEPALPAAPSPLAQILADERSQQVDRLLAKLDGLQADALRLRFFAGMTFPEIAETVGCSVGTAKNRVKAGLVRMAELMAAGPSGPSGPSRNVEVP